eukprot:8593994-Heterocapsa_arctica.AAC.1
MIRTCKKFITNPLVRKDIEKHAKIKDTPAGGQMGNLSIVWDVEGALKPPTLKVPGISSGEESLASLSPG